MHHLPPPVLEEVDDVEDGTEDKPSETPEVRWDRCDVKVFSWVNWVRPERDDLNQARGVSDIPIGVKQAEGSVQHGR